MSCGARNGYDDVCGETYTCPTCMMGDAVASLRARIAELERALEKIVEKSQNPYRDRHHECDSRLALQSIHDSVKSVLGKGE